MALLHQATLTPTKLDLATAWLPGRSWFAGLDVADLRQLGAFRFDDPEGEVGVETLLLLAVDGTVVQVPFTYRAAPLAGAKEYLVGTLEHSVLGTRWVYDGAGDPVWARATLAAVVGGAANAEELVDTPAGLLPRTPTASVRGYASEGAASGDVGVLAVTAVVDPAVVDGDATSTVTTDAGVLTLQRRLAPGASVEAEPGSLVGTWLDGEASAVLVRWAPA